MAEYQMQEKHEEFHAGFFKPDTFKKKDVQIKVLETAIAGMGFHVEDEQEEENIQELVPGTELTLYREFDYVVLISGDADHEMLARKLKALKTHSILMTWDPANTGSTSRFLSEEVCTHIDIMRLASKEPELLKSLTITK